MTGWVATLKRKLCRVARDYFQPHDDKGWGGLRKTNGRSGSEDETQSGLILYGRCGARYTMNEGTKDTGSVRTQDATQQSVTRIKY
jgi:hypothetical protein